MNTQKLISMVDFILNIDMMTTKEFCEKYCIPSQKCNVEFYLQIDAIKHKMFVEYAKFLNTPLKISMFYPFDENGKVMFYDGINFERGIKFKDSESKLLFNGFSLKGSYQSSRMTIHFENILNIYWWDRITQVWELSKGLKTIQDLVGYKLEYNKKSTF
jgi:hypothetical protein